MSIKIEGLDKVEAQSGPGILPPGKHVVKITEADDSEKSSGGHDQIALQYEATNGAGGLRDWLHVTERTMPRVKGFLEACGITIEPGEFELPTAQLVGKTLTIFVAQEPRRDDPTKNRTVVQGYSAAEAGSNGSSGGSDDDLPF